MAINNLTLKFLLKNKSNQGDKHPLYLRLTVDRKTSELSLKRRIFLEDWNQKSQRIKGSDQYAQTINQWLKEIEARIYRIYSDMSYNGEEITAKRIKEKYLGKDEKKNLLLENFRKHNERIAQLAESGNEYKRATVTRYRTTFMHVQDYVLSNGRNDIDFKDIDINWINGLDYYLKTEKGIGNNTTVKYIKNLKKIFRIAMQNGWVGSDPFLSYRKRLTPVKRDYLDTEELKRLTDKRITIDRLDQVRDVFLFCCYTGLRYSDVKNLTEDNLHTSIKGGKELHVQTQKTGSVVKIPLLSIPERILFKYQNNPKCISKGVLLPVLSNQKTNSYLKELADICSIRKHLTFHMARHTFSTTITLENGVSMESLKAMLGHSDIRTTQHYAKITDAKINQEMELVRNKIG